MPESSSGLPRSTTTTASESVVSVRCPPACLPAFLLCQCVRCCYNIISLPPLCIGMSFLRTQLKCSHAASSPRSESSHTLRWYWWVGGWVQRDLLLLFAWAKDSRSANTLSPSLCHSQFRVAFSRTFIVLYVEKVLLTQHFISFSR